MSTLIKKLVFPVFSIVLIALATTLAYQKFIAPHPEPITPSRAMAPPINTQSSPTATPLTSETTHIFADDAKWHLQGEGVLDQDFLDYTRWLNENHPGLRTRVLTRAQIQSTLNQYLDFMKSPQWLKWLQPDWDLPEDQLEDLKRLWRSLDVSVRRQFHNQFRQLKLQYMENGADSTPSFQSRVGGLFVRGTDNQIHSHSTKVSAPRDVRHLTPTHFPSVTEQAEKEKDLVKRWVFIVASGLAIIGLIYVVIRIFRSNG